MQDEDQDFDLKTPYVFIDTQSYTELRLDWDSRSLKRLQELTQAGTLKLLTTTITKREVRERLAERLADALAALKKAEPLLRQLHIFTAEQLSPDAALERLTANFEEFLTACHAQCIPLQIDAAHLVDDYFSRRPPFGEGRKKVEFPDAMVVQSLLAWCAKQNVTAYVVSRDPDLSSCCSPDGPLHHLKSVGELISIATASETIRDAFARFIEDNDEIKEHIRDKIRGLKLNMGWRDDIHLDEIDAGGMADWEINIIDRSGTFVSANLNVAVDIQIDVTIREEQPSFHDYWDVDVTVRHEHIEVTKGIYVEVEALLDRAEEAFEIQAIYVYLDEVEFDFNRGVGRTGRLSA